MLRRSINQPAPLSRRVPARPGLQGQREPRGSVRPQCDLARRQDRPCIVNGSDIGGIRIAASTRARRQISGGCETASGTVFLDDADPGRKNARTTRDCRQTGRACTSRVAQRPVPAIIAERSIAFVIIGNDDFSSAFWQTSHGQRWRCAAAPVLFAVHARGHPTAGPYRICKAYGQFCRIRRSRPPVGAQAFKAMVAAKRAVARIKVAMSNTPERTRDRRI